MPGIKKPWPEGAFLGFERDYFAADLGYHGPPFGWFDHSRPIHARALRRGRAGAGPRAALRPDRAGVEPHAVRAGAALCRRLARCRPLSSRSPRRSGGGSIASPTGSISTRPISPASPMICSTLAGWLARLDGDGARHHPRRPPAAGHRLGARPRPGRCRSTCCRAIPALLAPFRAFGLCRRRVAAGGWQG